MSRRKYSQVKATLAIAKASLKASFRNPSSVVFGFLFPLIFILVFGFIGSGSSNIDLYVDESSDIENPIYNALTEIDTVKFVEDINNDEAEANLEKGSIDAILNITNTGDDGNLPIYTIDVKTSEASIQSGNLFISILEGLSSELTLRQLQFENPIVLVQNEVVSGREYKSIDFILPGQLGFALLSSGIFSTAFVFISLKETLVVKRFFATPIRKSNILIGEALSRLVFSIIQAVIIISVGRLLFGFTLENGLITFLAMLTLSILGLIVFLGFGFVVSSIAKSEAAVPPIANLITLPQFLLAGTFFPIDSFPSWLQPISKVLPLTYLNDAMRQVAFEGASLFDVRGEIFILLAWGVFIYAVAIKIFKWE